MFSLNFMFFCSIIEELCTKEENYKTSCNFNFGHECNFAEFHCISKASLMQFSIYIPRNNLYRVIDNSLASSMSCVASSEYSVKFNILMLNSF